MRLPHIIAVATTAAVLGTAGVTVAAASSGGASTSSSTTTAAAAPHANAGAKAKARHPWLRRLARRAVGIAADSIGISRADLVGELRSGKTIGEVAGAHSVEPQTVINALVNAGENALDKAKAAGRITDKRYDRLEQRLPKAAERFVTKRHFKAAA